MIVSMILNAGLISILYPFAVFGYALMEEGRPKSLFWTFISNYTLFILTMKLIVQLDIWFLVGVTDTYYALDVSSIQLIYSELLDLRSLKN
jgi:hypothetical protein